VSSVEVEVEGKQLKLSNLDKVLYPEASFQGRPLNIIPLDQPFCTAHPP